MIRTPKQFADIARVGPIAHQGRTIHKFIADTKRTGVVAVALPEEMPVNETLQLRDELKDAGLALDRVIANGCYPKRFSVRDVRALRAAADDGRSPLARSAMRAALSEEARHRGQREQLARLEDGFRAAPVQLPLVFAPALDRDGLVELSETLEAAL